MEVSLRLNVLFSFIIRTIQLKIVWKVAWLFDLITLKKWSLILYTGLCYQVLFSVQAGYT